MHKDKLIATIQIKSLKVQSYLPTILVLSILWDESPVNVKKVVTELALDTGTVSPLLKEWNKLTSSNANDLKLINVKYLFILLRKAKNQT